MYIHIHVLRHTWRGASVEGSSVNNRTGDFTLCSCNLSCPSLLSLEMFSCVPDSELLLKMFHSH